MSTTEESVDDLIDTAEGFGRGMVSVENVELAQLLINSLIAAALADARRDGAEQMRAESAKLARALPLYYGSGDDGADESLAQAIEDLPLPAGPRQAVLLTDEQIAMALHIWGGNEPHELDFGNWRNDREAMGLIELSRVIETAVLAANNLEVRRG